jgi:Nucleotidyl transferase AbiEii toxin, Type IV TA system
MTFKYATPGAMEKAIRSKAREVARETSRAVGDLVLEFYFQRLLARIFQNDGWMLKGGQALLVRFPQQARASRDADLFRPGVDDINEALEELRGAVRWTWSAWLRLWSLVPGGGRSPLSPGIQLPGRPAIHGA